MHSRQKLLCQDHASRKQKDTIRAPFGRLYDIGFEISVCDARFDLFTQARMF